MINSQNSKETDSHKGKQGMLPRASDGGGSEVGVASENVHEVLYADKNLCQIEEWHNQM